MQEKSNHGEILLLCLGISLGVLSIVNYFLPVSPCKIVACALCALFISLSESSDVSIERLKIMCDYTIKMQLKSQEINYTMMENNEVESEQFPQEARDTIDKYNLKYSRRIKLNRISCTIFFAAAIIVLVIGLCTDIFPVNEKDANSMTLLSLAFIFTSIYSRKFFERSMMEMNSQIEKMDGMIYSLRMQNFYVGKERSKNI